MIKGEFVPNERYLKLTKKEKINLGIEAEPDENIVEKVLRKKSNMEDKKGATILSSRKFYGSVYLLEQAAKLSGVEKLLIDSFPKSYKKILSLCYFFILERHSALYRFDVWGRIHKHPYNYNISSSSSTKFLDSITENEKDYFLSKWARAKGDNEITAIDSTSISSYSQLLKMAKRGINKDHDLLNQLNVLVGFGADCHLPIYIKQLPGNISDVTTIKNLVDDFNSYGIKASTFFLDRGFYSIQNIGSMLDNNYHFLCMIKGHPLYIRNLFEDISDITSPIYFVKKYKINAVTKKYLLQYKKDDKHKSRTVYITKSYDPENAKNAKERFNIKIAILKEELQSKKIIQAKSVYNKYFNVEWEKEIVKSIDKKTGNIKEKIVETKIPLSFEYNEEKINEENNNLGWVCFISDIYKNPETVIEQYRKRDTVEKFFENLKERIGLKRFLSGKQTVVDSKLFFAFIALIIYSELETRKGKATLKQESLLKNYTMQKLFDDFDTIEEYQVAKGNFKLSEITKKQHDILTELCLPDLKN